MSGDDQSGRTFDDVRVQVPGTTRQWHEGSPIAKWVQEWRDENRGGAPLTADDAEPIGRALLIDCGHLSA